MWEGSSMQKISSMSRIKISDVLWHSTLFILFLYALNEIKNRYFMTLAQVQFDDSYITYRYAANLALGNGLVFNVGDLEPTNSASSLLWTLLLAVVGVVGIEHIPSVAIIFSMFFHVFTVLIIVGKISMKSSSSILKLIFGIFFFLNPWVLYWVFSGMETSLFLLLTVIFIRVCICIQLNQEDKYLTRLVMPLVIFLGVITRWELAAVILTALGVLLIQDFSKKRNLKLAYSAYFLLGFTSVVGLFSFYKVYYGSLVPNPIQFKNLVHYYSLSWQESGREMLNFLISPKTFEALIAFVLIGAICLIFLRVNVKEFRILGSRLLPIFSAFLVSVLFLLLSARSDFFRYPLILIVFITIFPNLLLGSPQAWGLMKNYQKIVISAALFALLVNFSVSIIKVLDNTSQLTGQYNYLQAERIAAGKFMEANLPTGQKVLSSDLGAISFYNIGNTYIDASGLTNRLLLESLTNGQGYRASIYQFDLDFLVDTTDVEGRSGSEFIFNNLSIYYSGEFKTEITCDFSQIYNRSTIRTFPEILTAKRSYVTQFKLDRIPVPKQCFD